MIDPTWAAEQLAQRDTMLGELRAAVDRERAAKEALVGEAEDRANEMAATLYEVRGALATAERERDDAKALAERWMLEKGRHQARCAVFMQAMATLARNGMQEQAQAWVAAADQAAADVRIEDFVVARVGMRDGGRT